MSTINPEMSRRDFLRAFSPKNAFGLGATLAASTMDLSLAHSEIFGSSIKYQDSLQLEGPFNISGLNLYTLVTEHDMNTWRRYEPEITKILNKFDVFIPEYFPPEYRSGNAFTRKAYESYTEQNYLFDKVEDHALKSSKEVWVVDPAYNAEFMSIRGVTFIAETVALVGLLGKVGDWNPDVERRTFLTHLKTAIQDIGMFGAGIMVLPEMLKLAHNIRGFVGDRLEVDFRLSVVEAAVNQLSGQIKDQTDILMIYPPAHWNRMKEGITECRPNVSFDKYRTLRDLPFFDSFFQARHFKSDGQNWQQLPGFNIM